MELEIIILNKSDRERQIVYDNTYAWSLKSTKLKWRVEWCYQKLRNGGIGELGSHTQSYN